MTLITEAFAALAQAFLGVVAIAWLVFAIKLRNVKQATDQAWTKAFTDMNNAFDDMVRAFTLQGKTQDNLVSWLVPSDQWGDVIELHMQLRAKGSEHRDYLVYCAQNGGFWAQGDHGYTKEWDKAKRFTAVEGLIMVLDRARNGDPHDCYTLVATVKPEAHQ